MILVLFTIIVLLIAIIVFLNVQHFQQKKSFQTRIKILQEIIVEISNKQSGQLQQLQLSEELQQRLKSDKAYLNESIFDLNYELIEMLSKNNLLK
jgi:hypothetical protein